MILYHIKQQIKQEHTKQTGEGGGAAARRPRQAPTRPQNFAPDPSTPVPRSPCPPAFPNNTSSQSRRPHTESPHAQAHTYPR